MQADQHGPAPAHELGKHTQDRFGRRPVHRRHLLVRHDQLPVLLQRPGHRDPLLLTTAQLVDALVEQLPHAQPVERMEGRLPVRACRCTRVRTLASRWRASPRRS